MVLFLTLALSACDNSDLSGISSGDNETAGDSSGDSDMVGESFVGLTNVETNTEGSSTSEFTSDNLLFELGAIWFEDGTTSEGVYHSTLFFFSENASFQEYNYQRPPETSSVQYGEWRIDESGDLIIDISGQKVAVTLVADYGWGDFGYREVVIDGETEPPYHAAWLSCDPELYPFDASLVPGTYTDQYGDLWGFNSDGTGFAPDEEGAFMWQVVDGLLVVSFTDGSEYWMYNVNLPFSEFSPSEQLYSEINCAFVEHDTNGDFDSYHGGMELIRQE